MSQFQEIGQYEYAEGNGPEDHVMYDVAFNMAERGLPFKEIMRFATDSIFNDLDTDDLTTVVTLALNDFHAGVQWEAFVAPVRERIVRDIKHGKSVQAIAESLAWQATQETDGPESYDVMVENMRAAIYQVQEEMMDAAMGDGWR